MASAPTPTKNGHAVAAPAVATDAASTHVQKHESSSLLQRTLTDARKDLWNAQLPRPLEVLFGPIRDFLLDPFFAVSSILLPPLLRPIPYGDVVAANVVVYFTLPVKMLYSLLPTRGDAEHVDLRLNAKNDLRVHAPTALTRGLSFHSPSDARSAFLSALAFATSAAADLVGAIMNPKKMKKWFDALGQFNSYLDASGVGEELRESMMKPLLRGRLLDNVKILNDIQEMNDVDRCERCTLGASGGSDHQAAQDITEELKNGHRMMRFATAAYGTEMIRSALDKDATPQQLADQKKAIAFHTGLNEEDVRYIYVHDGGDMKVLRHFVAVDRATKNVVLSLRGTLSISGALTDMQAMSTEFCTGYAHKGIAEMADNLWAESGDIIKQLFEGDDELRDFGLCIVGHSLGAGTACLLNVKLHVEKDMGDRTVTCYGFAPPPVFCLVGRDRDGPSSQAIERAVQNCVCYIHDNDCVPHLSVSSIRRLSKLLDAVDNQTEHMWAHQRFKLFWEWNDIPQDLIDSVLEEDGNESDAVDGECKVVIPARMICWLRKKINGPSFEAFGCDPDKVADLNIFMCEDMVTDHMPEMYEDALDDLVS